MSNALDVAIGVVFVYLLLALIVTTVQELISTLLSFRANDLYAAIELMLKGDSDDDLTKARELAGKLYQHPLIKNLVKEARPADPSWLDRVRGVGMPSYIPSRTFALALLDVLQHEQSGDPKDHKLISGLEELFLNARNIVEKAQVGGDLKRSLLLTLDRAKDRATLDALAATQAVAAASDRIEGLFNDRMARAGGWYKRKMQAISLTLSLLVSLAFNADTLRIAGELWKNSSLRAQVAAAAQTFHDSQGALKQPGAAASATTAEVTRLAGSLVKQSQELLDLGLPLGWAKFHLADVTGPNLAGWLITTLAVSLGAGFWFDVLSKALQLRGAGPKISPATGELEKKNGAS